MPDAVRPLDTAPSLLMGHWLLVITLRSRRCATPRKRPSGRWTARHGTRSPLHRSASRRHEGSHPLHARHLARLDGSDDEPGQSHAQDFCRLPPGRTSDAAAHGNRCLGVAHVLGGSVYESRRGGAEQRPCEATETFAQRHGEWNRHQRRLGLLHRLHRERTAADGGDRGHAPGTGRLRSLHRDSGQERQAALRCGGFIARLSGWHCVHRGT